MIKNNSIMLAKIIFFAAVSAAILSVILLPLLSRSSAHKESTQSGPCLDLSLYIQQLLPNHHKQPNHHLNTAFIFHHNLTEGPDNTSRVIGRAQGFVVPVSHPYAAALSAFNILYLTFDTPEYSGSVGVEVKQLGRGIREELIVLGGTGSFAFARGEALLVQKNRKLGDTDVAMYNIKLRLKFPRPPSPIPML